MTKMILVGITAIVLIAVVCVAAQAEESIRLNLVPQRDAGPVTLENFPEVGLEFSLVTGNKYEANITQSDLRIFEDGIEVTPIISTTSSLVEERKPMTHSIIFDIGDNGTGIEKELFQKLISALGGISFNNLQQIDNKLDTWNFCATSFVQICKPRLQGMLSTRELHSSLDPIYLELTRPANGTPLATLSIILQRVLLLDESETNNKHIVVIVKKGSLNSTIPYISDTISDELSRRRIPVFLINLDNDTGSFNDDTRIRLARLEGKQFSRYGDNRWDRPEGLIAELKSVRPTHFKLTYMSLLFHDNQEHRVSLVYHQAKNDEAWAHGEFRFLPVNRGVKSELTWLPRATTSTTILAVSVLLILVILILVTDDIDDIKVEE